MNRLPPAIIIPGSDLLLYIHQFNLDLSVLMEPCWLQQAMKRNIPWKHLLFKDLIRVPGMLILILTMSGLNITGEFIRLINILFQPKV